VRRDGATALPPTVKGSKILTGFPDETPMKLHDKFGWDPKKAKGNPKKHGGVTFDDAAAVLGDDQGDVFHVEVFDDAHSMREDRHITTGSHPANRRIVLIISWTDRSTDEGQITHIISARPATPQERKRYAEAISGQ
jgi:uncharacterized DUF497 family protein